MSSNNHRPHTANTAATHNRILQNKQLTSRKIKEAGVDLHYISGTPENKPTSSGSGTVNIGMRAPQQTKVKFDNVTKESLGSGGGQQEQLTNFVQEFYSNKLNHH